MSGLIVTVDTAGDAGAVVSQRGTKGYTPVLPGEHKEFPLPAEGWVDVERRKGPRVVVSNGTGRDVFWYDLDKKPNGKLRPGQTVGLSKNQRIRIRR